MVRQLSRDVFDVLKLLDDAVKGVVEVEKKLSLGAGLLLSHLFLAIELLVYVDVLRL